MARFSRMPYQPGCRLQVNVDQITYLQRGAKDEYTRIHFVGTDQSIGVQEAHNKLWGREICFTSVIRSWRCALGNSSRSSKQQSLAVAVGTRVTLAPPAQIRT